MNWEETRYGPALVGPAVYAKIRRFGPRFEALITSSSLVNYTDTEQDAKEWAEARMNEIKKEFILSLITKIRNTEYGFGGILEIFGGYEGVDEWTVYHGDTTVHEGTLEECKNYIVSCF